MTPTQLTTFTVTGNFNAVADPAVSGNVNSPVFQPVNGLITFTPRLPRGEQLFVSDYLITPAYNAEQTIYLIGNPTGGTFTLSYGGYTTKPVTWDAPANASQNDVQTVTVTGSPTGGNFTLTFGGQTTSSIAYNATAATVQSSLTALSSIGANNATVAGSAGGPYTVTFTGSLANYPQSLITATAGLTGGTSPGVSVAHSVTGVASIQSALRALPSIISAVNDVQTITLSGTPTGGTFTLSFGGQTTSALAYNASASAVQAALQSISSVGSGNATVTGSAGGPYTITFVGSLGYSYQPLITATSSLTPASTVTVSHTTAGGNVTVTTGRSPLSYDVLFSGPLGSQVIPAISADASNLTNVEGPGYCEITVTVTSTGSPQITGDTAISLPPLTARIFEGVLSTIDYADTPGFQLVANTGLNISGDLIYDVTFSNVTFNGSSQYLAPFAFTAPTTSTTISITSPSLELLPYQAPQDAAWSPSTTGYPMSTPSVNWRQRATLRSA